MATPSEKKEKRKEKFKDEYNVLRKKDYDSLSKNDKKKYDFAKENNLIVGQKKKGTLISNYKHVKIFDPVDYTVISAFQPFEPTTKTLNRRFQYKKDKELEKAKLPFDKRRNFSTDYGMAVGVKPDMSDQWVVSDTRPRKRLIEFLAERNTKKNKGGSVGYTQRWKKARGKR